MLEEAPWPNGKGKGVWDYSHGVRRESKRTGEPIHIVRMHELLPEKNSELPKGRPGLKLKGRRVLLGSMVKDGKSEAAVYAEVASASAALEAARALRV